jgi:peptidoglycan/xylan/chitin deacetylase (PgdA/CDA1 family)
MNYAISAGVMMEDFDNINDWTITGTGSTQSNDTENIKTGSNSIKIITGVATTTSIVKTISFSNPNPGIFGFWFYIDDTANISQLDIFLSSTSSISSKYFQKSFTTGSGVFSSGWNFLTVPNASWTSVGGETWDNTMIRLKFRVWVPSSKISTVNIDSLYYGLYAKPKCLIMFDDGWKSAYDYGFNYLKSLGLKATYYIISSANSSNYMTTSEMSEMYALGNDICNHSSDIVLLATLDYQGVVTKITTCSDYLENLGFTRSYKHIAYPGGSYNNTVLQACEDLGILTGVTVNSSNISTIKGVKNYLTLSRYNVANTTSLATAKGYIDTAINNGETVALLFHKLATLPTISTEWSISDFQSLVNYIKSKTDDGLIDVQTISEWKKGMDGYWQIENSNSWNTKTTGSWYTRN